MVALASFALLALKDGAVPVKTDSERPTRVRVTTAAAENDNQTTGNINKYLIATRGQFAQYMQV